MQEPRTPGNPNTANKLNEPRKPNPQNNAASKGHSTTLLDEKVKVALLKSGSCFYCHKQGHMFRDCSDWKKNGNTVHELEANKSKDESDIFQLFCLLLDCVSDPKTPINTQFWT